MKYLHILRYWYWDFKYRQRWQALNDVKQPPYLRDGDAEYVLYSAHFGLSLAKRHWENGEAFYSIIMPLDHPGVSWEPKAKSISI